MVSKLPIACTSVLSRVWLFVNPRTAACQAPLSMGFSRHEYWSEVPFPPPGHFSDPGIEPTSLGLLHGQADSLPLVPPGKPKSSILTPKHTWRTHVSISMLRGSQRRTRQVVGKKMKEKKIDKIEVNNNKKKIPYKREMDGESYVEDLWLQSIIRGLNLNSDFVTGASDLITVLCLLYI